MRLDRLRFALFYVRSISFRFAFVTFLRSGFFFLPGWLDQFIVLDSWCSVGSGSAFAFFHFTFVLFVLFYVLVSFTLIGSRFTFDSFVAFDFRSVCVLFTFTFVCRSLSVAFGLLPFSSTTVYRSRLRSGLFVCVRFRRSFWFSPFLSAFVPVLPTVCVLRFVLRSAYVLSLRLRILVRSFYVSRLRSFVPPGSFFAFYRSFCVRSFRFRSAFPPDSTDFCRLRFSRLLRSVRLFAFAFRLRFAFHRSVLFWLRSYVRLRFCVRLRFAFHVNSFGFAFPTSVCIVLRLRSTGRSLRFRSFVLPPPGFVGPGYRSFFCVLRSIPPHTYTTSLLITFCVRLFTFFSTRYRFVLHLPFWIIPTVRLFALRLVVCSFALLRCFAFCFYRFAFYRFFFWVVRSTVRLVVVFVVRSTFPPRSFLRSLLVQFWILHTVSLDSDFAFVQLVGCTRTF